MAEAAPGFISGFDGTAAIQVSGATKEFAVVQWSINVPTDIIKIMNSRSGVFKINLGTFRDASGSIVIDYDLNNPTFSASSGGFNIQSGSVMSGLQLFINQTSRYSGSGTGTGSLDGPYWYVGSALVHGLPQSVNNAGKVGTMINWVSGSASIQYPS